MRLEELFKLLDLMISRAEIWEGPISKRKRVNLWERNEIVYSEEWN